MCPVGNNGVVTDIFLAAVGILVSDWGAIFYKANCIAMGNKPFRMYKFRSVNVLNASKNGDEVSLRPDEDRFFHFVHFIINAKIDELQLLIHILNDTMSIVSPRSLLRISLICPVSGN